MKRTDTESASAASDFVSNRSRLGLPPRVRRAGRLRARSTARLGCVLTPSYRASASQSAARILRTGRTTSWRRSAPHTCTNGSCTCEKPIGGHSTRPASGQPVLRWPVSHGSWLVPRIRDGHGGTQGLSDGLHGGAISNPLCVKRQVPAGRWTRRSSGVWFVISVVFGFGSDRSEEPGHVRCDAGHVGSMSSSRCPPEPTIARDRAGRVQSRVSSMRRW